MMFIPYRVGSPKAVRSLDQFPTRLAKRDLMAITFPTSRCTVEVPKQTWKRHWRHGNGTGGKVYYNKKTYETSPKKHKTS